MCARCWGQNLEGLENAGNISPATLSERLAQVGRGELRRKLHLLARSNFFQASEGAARGRFASFRPSGTGSSHECLASSARTNILHGPFLGPPCPGLRRAAGYG